MIKINQISKTIKNSIVLDAVDFEVKAGEIVGLVGPNGAGKTTLLNIMAGIWPPDSGKVEIDGQIAGMGNEAIKRRIGYVPDVPFYYPKLTGREFLSFTAALYRLDEDAVRNRMDEIEKALELSSWMNELMEGYPRGIKQKMTLAAMLLHSPGFILLDEPLTNLDPKSSKLV
jgi:ABC-2 type transport system ATP-binding protein